MRPCQSRTSRMHLPAIVSVFVLLPCLQVRGEDTGKEVGAELPAKAEQGVEQHRKGEAVIRFQDRQGQPVANVPVRIRQTGHEFLFGCIAFDLVRSNDLYKPDLWKQRFSELFNFAVFPFYWSGYERQPGVTTRDDILEAVKWCQANGITTKGHPLVWTNPAGIPRWTQQYPPEKSEELVLDRVQREVAGFAGRIDIWDVVNEPIHCRAWKNVAAEAYRQEQIPDIADYVDKAFRTAHEANPGARLILNEFYVIAREADRERFYQLVTELKRRGTPISGLGIQAHEPREEWFAPEKVWATLDRLGSLGYPLHITEYIPQSGGKPITGSWREGTWTEQTQAEFADQFYRLCFGHPAVVSINWWGLSDRQIWLPGGGLLDSEYQPKPVYNRLKDLIRRQWNTSIDARTDTDGRITFHGFYGLYEIAIEPENHPQRTYQIALYKDKQNQWVFMED